jgi:nucleoid DNA-binding protein
MESNMDELIKTIMEKAGITEEAARGIIDEVVAYTKSKVPGPFQHFVDQIFERDE